MRKPATKPFDRMPRVGDRVVSNMQLRYDVPVNVDPQGWTVTSMEQVGRVWKIEDSLSEGLSLVYMNAEHDSQWSNVEFWDANKGDWAFKASGVPSMVYAIDPEPINNFIATLRTREDYVRRMVL